MVLEIENQDIPNGFITEDAANSIRRDLDRFSGSSEEVRSVCDALRDCLNLPTNSILASLQESLPPEVLATSSTLTANRIFFTIRRVLNAAGAIVEQGRGTAVPPRVFAKIYEDIPHWLAEANERYENHKATTSPRRHQASHSQPEAVTTNTQPQHRSHYSLSRNRQAVSTLFNDQSKKFSGSICSKDAPLHRVKRQFKAVIEEQDIPQTEGIKLIHHCLSGQANDFFYKNVRDVARDIEDAFFMLEEQFYSPHHQSQAQTYLDRLTIKGIVQEKNCSIMEALNTAHERIADFIPRCGPDVQGETHMMRALAKIVDEEDWAQDSLRNRLTSNEISYNTFYSSLMSALTLNVNRENKESSETSRSGIIPVLYGETYVNPRNTNARKHNGSVRHKGPPRRSPAQLIRLKNKTRCLNCGKIGHWRAECPSKKRLSTVDAVRARIKERGGHNIAMAEVLYEMAFKDDCFHEVCLAQSEHPTHDNALETLDAVAERSYTNEEAIEDITNTFENLVAHNERHNDDTTDGDSFSIAHVSHDTDTPCDTQPPKKSSKICTPLSETHNSHTRRRTPSALHVCGRRFSQRRPNQLTKIQETTVYHIPTSLQRLKHTTRRNGTKSMFHGAVMDIGAQKSVIGIIQAHAYCKKFGLRLRLSPFRNVFRFGSQRHRSIGMLTIVIPTPRDTLQIPIDVVNIDVPLLFGLDLMDKYSLQVLTVSNQLENVSEKWKIPLLRKRGHVYLDWDNQAHTVSSIFYSRTQLERLHRHLMHPSAGKLYALLLRSVKNTNELPPDTMDALKSISKACTSCIAYSPKQMVFQIRDSDEIQFNHEVILDIMYLDSGQNKNTPVLHVIDAGTRFNAAEFLPKVDVASIWNTFLQIWSTKYIGFPESVLTDQGSVFISKEWRYNCEISDIHLKHTGTESHNSLGAGEKYHSTLRTVYRKVRYDFPHVPAQICLSVSVKAINDTVGPSGLIPTLLVFGVMPKLPTISPKEFPAQRDRLRAMHSARAEYERIVSKHIIQRGLRQLPPPAATHTFTPGHFAYVYREKLKQYTGPHLIASVNGKEARLHVNNTSGPRAFNIAQLKPAPLNSTPHPDDNLAVKSTSYSEIISKDDPRTALFDDAKRKEIMSLINRGTFKVVLREEAGDNPNILPSRYVLSIKHKTDGPDIYKARYVVGGHRDRDKSSVVHNATTLKQSSVRTIMALATILGFHIWSVDVKQAYLQAGSKLQRKVFVKPEMVELAKDELLQLVRPLYGLTESGDYWHETATRFHTSQLRMKQSTSDFSLFFRRISDRLVALSGAYVDDILQAGTPEQKKFLIDTMEREFDIKTPERSSFEYTGIQCNTSNPLLRTLSQKHYIHRLQALTKNASYEQFRSLRAKLA